MLTRSVVTEMIDEEVVGKNELVIQKHESIF